MIRTVLEVFHIGATEDDGGEGTASRLLLLGLLLQGLLLLQLLLLLLLLQDHCQSALRLGLTLGVGHRHCFHIDAVVGELGREVTAYVGQVQFLGLLNVLG